MAESDKEQANAKEEKNNKKISNAKKQDTSKSTKSKIEENVTDTKTEKKESSVKDKVKEVSEKLDLDIDTDEIKNETYETYNQVKDTFKNVDIKNDAETAKNFIKEVFADPFSAIKDASNEKNNVFGKAIIIVVLWIAIGFIAQFVSNIHYHFSFSELIRSLLNPLWYVCVISGITYLFNRENKKPLTTVIATIVTASVPRFFISLVALINGFVAGLEVITEPINYTLRVATIVLTYFGMKGLLGIKQDTVFVRKFVIMVVVIEFVFKLLSSIGIGSIVL